MPACPCTVGESSVEYKDVSENWLEVLEFGLACCMLHLASSGPSLEDCLLQSWFCHKEVTSCILSYKENLCT